MGQMDSVKTKQNDTDINPDAEADARQARQGTGNPAKPTPGGPGPTPAGKVGEEGPLTGDRLDELRAKRAVGEGLTTWEEEELNKLEGKQVVGTQAPDQRRLDLQNKSDAGSISDEERNELNTLNEAK